MKKTHLKLVLGKSRGVLSILALALSCQGAAATTFTVNNLNDSGPGSLHQALSNANSSAGADVISISVTGTITLQSPLPVISEGVTINGSGSGNLTVSGNNLYRVFFVDAAGGNVNINNLTIADGHAKGGNGGNGGSGAGGGGLGAGGALFANAGTVTFSNVQFVNNSAVGGNGGTGAWGGNSGGGGGLNGDGGHGGYIAGGGGGGLYGRGGDAFTGGQTGGAAGGGGGIYGAGGRGGNYTGGGGGALTDGQPGGATGGVGGTGGGGTGGNGTYNHASTASGQSGQANGGGGGGGNGYGDIGGYFGGHGGNGGKFGGGGGAQDGGNGGNGGDFGGGGGPGLSSYYGDGLGRGGAGGFGGGSGGTGSSYSNGGGFGGGAGGNRFPGSSSPGPFGGGAGYDYYSYSGGGGGGAALGGAIFVRANNGASVVFIDSVPDAGSVTAGIGGQSSHSGSQASAWGPGGNGAASGSSMFLLGGTTTFTVNNGVQTISGSVAGWDQVPAGIVKNGAGTLVISGTQSYHGGTAVNAGVLKVNGTISPSQVTVNSGGTLAGTGSVASLVVNSDGTISPGSSPGILNSGSTVWSGAGNYNWQMYNATAVAGTGFDQLNINGTLDVTAANSFDINLWSLSGVNPDANGNAINFNNLTAQSWIIVKTTGGIVGFSASKFNIVTGTNNGTAGFSNPLLGGHFTVTQSGNNLLLNFVPGTDNADLTGLTSSTGNLLPSFSTGTTAYSMSLPTSTAGISFTPTVLFPSATVQARVNGGAYTNVVSGSASANLPLTVGNNTIDIKVTAANGVNTKTYTVTVERRSGPFVTVSNLNDSGVGSLRQAVLDAAYGETVQFNNLSGVIKMNSGVLLNKGLNVAGPGANKLVIDMQQTGNAFAFDMTVFGGVSSISGLTISNAVNAIYTGGGGGYGTVNISNIVVVACTGQDGTAIYNWLQKVNIYNSTFYNNVSGFFVYGFSTLYNRGEMNIYNSTLSGNVGWALLNNTDNHNPKARLQHVTFVGNTYGFNSAPLVTVQNSLMAGNTIDVDGAVNSLGGNLIGNGANASGITHGINGDQVGTAAAPIDAKVGALQMNGGATPTRALLDGSPAINGGTAISTLPSDQRGSPRGSGSFADIGAFEVLNIDEQIDAKLGDNVDTNLLSRASQTSVDNVQTAVTGVQTAVNTVQTSVNSIQSTITSRLDTTVGSRASQTTADSILNKVNTLDTSRLDVNVSSRASQASVDSIGANLGGLITSSATHASQTSLNGLSNTVAGINGRIDTNIASRASQTTTDSIKTKVDSNLDATVSSRATQSSVDTKASQATADSIKSKVDSTLDATVASRATQSSVDTKASQATADSIKNKVDSTLDATIASRATQSSVDTKASQATSDSIKNKVDSTLDTTVASRATQTSVDSVQARANILSTQSSVDAVQNKANTLSSQSSVDAANALLALNLDTNIVSRASQDSLDTGVTTVSSKVDDAKATLSDAVQTSTTSLTDGLNSVGAANQANFSGVATTLTGLSQQLGNAQSDLSTSLNSGFSAVQAQLNSAQSGNQANLDDLVTNTIVTLTSNVLTRASQASLDAAQTSLNDAHAKLDAAGVSLLSVHGKLDASVDTTVSSRATQTSVDAANNSLAAANASLGVLDGKLNARLDSTVSSRATQTSVDTLQTKANTIDTHVLSADQTSQSSFAALNSKVDTNEVAADAFRDLSLRVQIEMTLKSGSDRVVLFFLPAARGGQLEYVRDIVTYSYQQCQAAGLPTAKAGTFLASGNTAFTAGQFKTAYDWYLKSYQELVK